MNLITFTYELIKDGQAELVEAVEALKESWGDQGFTVSLFRDMSQQDRFLHIFLTEKSIDELTDMIQNDPRAKAVFDRVRESESRVVVSYMEQIL